MLISIGAADLPFQASPSEQGASPKSRGSDSIRIVRLGMPVVRQIFTDERPSGSWLFRGLPATPFFQSTPLTTRYRGRTLDNHDILWAFRLFSTKDVPCEAGFRRLSTYPRQRFHCLSIFFAE
jgi:hypothetical protein